MPHLIFKIIYCGKQDSERFSKIWGNLQQKRDMCMRHILENAWTQIAISAMHKKKKWMRSMQQIYAQC